MELGRTWFNAFEIELGVRRKMDSKLLFSFASSLQEVVERKGSYDFGVKGRMLP
jgi:hypothetical protein